MGASPSPSSGATASARSVRPGFFPLDDELALLPGSLTPRLQESLVRLGTLLPSFELAAAELAFHTGVEVHRTTATRLSEAAGAAAVAVQEAEVATILRDYPEPPVEPERLVMHVDGALVPLRHGAWGEVKTLAIGVPAPPVEEDGELVVHTRELSYCSRLTDSTTFADAATGEAQRRGVTRAKRVGAVVDGAEWIQGFIDLHAPAAVRILDFPHAAAYVTAIGQAQGGEGALLSAEALRAQLHKLKHEGPEEVLACLRRLVEQQAKEGKQAAELEVLEKRVAYLDKRVAQMQYARFREEGWPLGSGSGESANKLVVEARLKGAGMHWAVENVNPMVALRNAVCNGRWREVWEQIEAQQRRQVQLRREARHRRRTPQASGSAPCRAAPRALPQAAPPAAPSPPALKERAGDGRPAADHPWRRAWSPRRQRELAGTA